MAVNFDKTTQMLEHSLDARLDRSRLLAQNLANLDTPNYRAKDLKFEGFLKQAEAVSGADSAQLVSAETTEVVVSDRPADGLDGNAVDLDTEVAKMADNTTRYNVALEAMRRKFALLSYAASGQ